MGGKGRGKMGGDDEADEDRELSSLGKTGWGMEGWERWQGEEQKRERRLWEEEPGKGAGKVKDEGRILIGMVGVMSWGLRFASKWSTVHGAV